MAKIKIRTDDGAVGKAMSTKRIKQGDSDQTVCEIKVQMSVNRREFEQLAGFPERFADHFYADTGLPVAPISILMLKRELECRGALHRGEQQTHANLHLERATATDLRFVLEPNSAVFICALKWLAAGDEVDEISGLLGCPCEVALEFSVPAEQGKLPFGKHKPIKAEDQFITELADCGIDMPGDHEVWTTMTPQEISRLMKYVEDRKAGKAGRLPAIAKPFKTGS